MHRFAIRTAVLICLCCQALTAQALFVLPEDCQPFGSDLVCDAHSGPQVSEAGLLVGHAIWAKLSADAPSLSLPSLETGFLQDWSQAWTSLPVPSLVESFIEALHDNDFAQWIDWLCFNLQPDIRNLPIIDFPQVPWLVVDSLPLTVETTIVPLPASAWLFVSAIAGLAIGGKHRIQK